MTSNYRALQSVSSTAPPSQSSPTFARAVTSPWIDFTLTSDCGAFGIPKYFSFSIFLSPSHLYKIPKALDRGDVDACPLFCPVLNVHSEWIKKLISDSKRGQKQHYGIVSSVKLLLSGSRSPHHTEPCHFLPHCTVACFNVHTYQSIPSQVSTTLCITVTNQTCITMPQHTLLFRTMQYKFKPCIAKLPYH